MTTRTGPSEYWRSLEELSQTQEFRELVEREFPSQAEILQDPISRRRFLQLMAASLALAGLDGCAPTPPESILPYVRAPEGLVPGKPLYFATAMTLQGYAQGLLVQSREGRPIKIEGNPDHPANPLPANAPPHARFGPTDVFAQASLLTLYDPDRARTVTHLGNISSWDYFLRALRSVLDRSAGSANARLRVLTEAITSPTLAHQLRRLRQKYPSARWHCYEPVGTENVKAGIRRAFGERLQPQYRIDQADVILALDADFLSCGPGHLRHVHDFSNRRRLLPSPLGRGDGGEGQAGPRMNRLYAVESTLTNTGAVADHRLPLRSADMEALLRALAGRVDNRFRSIASAVPPHIPPSWIDALARDLLRHRGTSVIIGGESQPPLVHTLIAALNDFLDNTGKTVYYTGPVEADPPQPGSSLRDLAQDMQDGLVDVLIILGANPVYTAPADLRFGDCMERVPFRAHISLYEDETSERCHWHIPENHYLESWGDARAYDGTISIIQPLIAPLYEGKTALELLAVLTEQPERSSYEIVRAYWRNLFDTSSSSSDEVRSEWERQGLLGAFTGQFEAWWSKAVHDGLVQGSSLPAKSVSLRTDWLQNAGPAPRHAAGDLEIVFRPDPTVFDGRFANNGWLQELPKPLSKLTWDNTAYISAATAVRLGFAPADRPEQANGKTVELRYRDSSVQAPLWVMPGHADDSITVHLGYGRTRAGKVGTGLGFNAYKLRHWDTPWFGLGLTVHDMGRCQSLACTQQHHLMDNRDLVRAGTVDNPPAMPQPPRRSLTLYNENEHATQGEQWGMVIDLGVCTGCSACIVACQSENNIPIVGKDQVLRGREMHWLRVDHYHKGTTANPETYFQPVPCMHCENAPCEVVCPVVATAHSSDGLNDMIYNRCVGTRYCSNNCPYKVRRFNFFAYADFSSELMRLMRNPEVTVRSRGVMEKCTYCVQRIRATQIEAHKEDRPVRDGEVMTACQAACPAGAILFGNLNDRDAQGRARSKVAQLKVHPLNYGLLADLNTRPRTTYLAALKNPNPEIAISS